MLELGIVLLASALLAIFAARALFQRPSPPRWATMDTPVNLVVVAITALAGFGLFGTAIGLAGVLDGSQSAIHALAGAALLALLVGAVVGYRRFRHRPTGLAG